MDMTGKELLKLLKKEGWEIIRIEGSHHILRKNGKTLVLPVHGNQSVPNGLLNRLLKDAGIK